MKKVQGLSFFVFGFPQFLVPSVDKDSSPRSYFICDLPGEDIKKVNYLSQIQK